MKHLNRVVITGIGALTPLGNSALSFWDNLLKGTPGGASITKFDASKFKTQFACEVKGYNPQDFFDRKEARKLDLFSQYAVVASDEAIKDANLLSDDLDRNRVGVIWAAGNGGIKSFQDECQNFFEGDGSPRFNPFFIPRMIIDIAGGHISIKHGFRGPNFSTVSACASSTNAIIDAYNYLRLGKANVIISGGSEAAVTEVSVGGFNALRALSMRNDDPATASRPFDQDRDGFVLGEGAGAFVLETLEHAQKRGAKIYAEIVGGGMSGDAHHMTAPHPEGIGALLVMKDALSDNEISSSKIDYINVHGTSTPLGDTAELKAVTELMGDSIYDVHISSTKSMTGHLLGAAGAIEALATTMAVYTDKIPPTINQFNLDENIDSKLNLTPNKFVEKEVNYALSNTFGFGGHNASLLFTKFRG